MPSIVWLKKIPLKYFPFYCFTDVWTLVILLDCKFTCILVIFSHIGCIMSENRQICVYAAASLKQNSTNLLIAMCCGIGLALYGCHVASQMSSNPTYIPSTSIAIHWLNDKLATSLGNPMNLIKGNCNVKQHSRYVADGFIYILKLFATYSGLMNGIINLAQILLLKMKGYDMIATNIIVSLSVLGILVSLMCIMGSYATCKIVCLSCIGLHHGFIIYYGLRRRKMLSNLVCPSTEGTLVACNVGNTQAALKSSSVSMENPMELKRRRRSRGWRSLSDISYWQAHGCLTYGCFYITPAGFIHPIKVVKVSSELDSWLLDLITWLGRLLSFSLGNWS